MALTADAIHAEFADETFAIIASLNSAARQNMPIQSTTAVTVGLPVDSIITKYAGASTAVTATITSAGIRVENSNVATAVTATLTAAVTKGVVADAQLSVIESSTNQISSLYYVTTIPIQVIAGTNGSIIRGHTVNSLLGAISTFIAKVKKTNQYTDHDIVVFGEVMPRRWVGQLGDTRWVGDLATQRNWAGEILTKRWANGILVDRNKFATLVDKRWRGNLQ